MIALADQSPEVNVAAAEYQRLLGYPRDHVMEGRAVELAVQAREWYAEHGRPWIWAREAESVSVAGEEIRIEGASFRSWRLARTLEQAEAHGAVLVAVGAGPEVEAQAHRLWVEEKPDEYFFLEMYGSAVVEHLTTLAGARLCGWADSNAMAVLPHYSPGYPEWDIGEQGRLRRLFGELPQRLDVLDSGMLVPKKSLLAVFGLTRHVDRVRRLTDLVPCENCSFAPCQFRRAPYRREPLAIVPLVRDANYAVNRKALRRWAAERLKLEDRQDGGVDAVFRFDGTTCTNMGQPLAFYYGVKVGPRTDGYRIQESWCGPAPGDVGHTFMCKYRTDAEQLMAAIAAEKPLLGRRLDEVLTWKRAVCSAGCYCDSASREHKWGLVLETIHYALAQRESNDRT